MHSDLLKSGLFPANEDKSQWEPIQIITWLGVILNTIEGSIKATDERIAKLSYDLEILLPFHRLQLSLKRKTLLNAKQSKETNCFLICFIC